jgi:hypothetical protein
MMVFSVKRVGHIGGEVGVVSGVGSSCEDERSKVVELGAMTVVAVESVRDMVGPVRGVGVGVVTVAVGSSVIMAREDVAPGIKESKVTTVTGPMKSDTVGDTITPLDIEG